MDILQAHKIYRDSPNTFGHEENDVPRAELKKLIGLVASQAMLQRTIKDGAFNGYQPESKALTFAWERLQVVEDQLRQMEKKYGKTISDKGYLTNLGGQGLPRMQGEGA